PMKIRGAGSPPVSGVTGTPMKIRGAEAPGLRGDGYTNEDPRCGSPPGLRSAGCMKVIACKHATRCRCHPQPARAGAPPARSVTPEGGGCKAAGTRLSGVSLNGDPTQSGETPDDRGPARSAPRSPE